MSLYVVQENQELLWNVISKNIYIRDYFAPYNSEKKNEWFKTIIRMFYEKYKTQNLTVADLNNVNKETISYMIHNVREQINQSVAKTSAPTQSVPSYQPANSYGIHTPPIVPDTRQEIYAKEFEQRQLEYANLNKKPSPDKVDFAEKIEDGVIQNMDELVKLQMQQRAYEMTMIPPPINQTATEVISPVKSNVKSSIQTAPPKLQIDTTSNIEISIEEIIPSNNKKSVTWKTDETTSTIESSVDPDINHVNKLETEIRVLRESVDNITHEFLQFKQLYELSQNSIVELKESYTDLTQKYTELLANQMQSQSQSQSQERVPTTEIKLTMERILTQLDDE